MAAKTKVAIIVPEKAYETYENIADYTHSALLSHVLFSTRIVDEIIIYAVEDVIQSLKALTHKKIAAQFHNILLFKSLDSIYVNQIKEGLGESYAKTVFEHLRRMGEDAVNLFVFILDHGDAFSVGSTHTLTYADIVTAACKSSPANVFFFCSSSQSGTLADYINIHAIAKKGLGVDAACKIVDLINKYGLDPRWPSQFVNLVRSVNLSKYHSLIVRGRKIAQINEDASKLYVKGYFDTVEELYNAFNLNY